MPEKHRPTYSGVPSRAEAELAARRQRAEDVQAPPAPPAPAPRPALVEASLKAIEDRLARVEDKLDTLLAVLTDGGAPGADPPQPSPAKKRR